MDDLTCPNCSEEDDLLGERDGDAITVTCQKCGCVWDRNLIPRCPSCGRHDMREALQAILDKSRGTQLSIQSMRVIYLCPDCDATKLRRWLDSNTPLPPDELPV